MRTLLLLLLLALLLLDQDVERTKPILKQQVHRLVLLHERRGHKPVQSILNQLAEINAQTPRVRPMTLKALKQDPLNLLLNMRLASHEQRVQQ